MKDHGADLDYVSFVDGILNGDGVHCISKILVMFFVFKFTARRFGIGVWSERCEPSHSQPGTVFLPVFCDYHSFVLSQVVVAANLSTEICFAL